MPASRGAEGRGFPAHRCVFPTLLLLGVSALAQGRVSPAGHLQTARQGHTATRLRDGSVLVVGGRGVDGLAPLASVERYQPRTGRWTPAAPLLGGRSQHTATLLADGRVLVVGGAAMDGDGESARFVALETVEFYEPRTDRWRSGPPLAEAREGHTATLLADGSVLVVGGTREGRRALATVERLAPGGARWERAAPLPRPRWLHQAVRAGDGTVVVLGGWSRPEGGAGAPAPSVEVARYRLEDDAWEPGPTLAEGRVGGAAAWVEGLGVLTLGGHTGATVTNLGEAWLPPAAAFSPLEPALPGGLAHLTATPLPGGGLLVVGGEGAETAATAAVLRWARRRWCPAGQLALARTGHTATALADGRVLVVGGSAFGLPEASAEVWRPEPGGCPAPTAR